MSTHRHLPLTGDSGLATCRRCGRTIVFIPAAPDRMAYWRLVR